MKVQWLGEPGGPDEITMSGFAFERKGEPVEVPDNHPHAAKFIGNHYFRVEQAPQKVALPAPDRIDDEDEADAAPRAPRVKKVAAKAKAGPRAKAPKTETVPAADAGEEPKTA